MPSGGRWAGDEGAELKQGNSGIDKSPLWRLPVSPSAEPAATTACVVYTNGVPKGLFWGRERVRLMRYHSTANICPLCEGLPEVFRFGEYPPCSLLESIITHLGNFRGSLKMLEQGHTKSTWVFGSSLLAEYPNKLQYGRSVRSAGRLR